MARFVEVKLPVGSPEKTLKLCSKAIERDTDLGAGSPLAGLIDMVAFGTLLTTASGHLKDSKDFEDDAQGTRGELMKLLGIGKGQGVTMEQSIHWYVAGIRDILLIKHRGSEQGLETYGFSVVISFTGARKHVRVDIPDKSPEDMVKLAEAIVEEHTNLGLASPLTAAIDMTTFMTKTTDARTLFDAYEDQVDDKESSHGEAIHAIGYADGQTSQTPGTLYFGLIDIRRRLLQVYTNEEEKLEKWGFDVVVHEHSVGTKKGAVSIKGTVTDQNGNPINGGLVHVVETDTFTVTDAQGRFSFPKMDPGSYTLQSGKTGFANFQAQGVQVVKGQTTTFNISLLPLSSLASVSGTVLKTGVAVPSIVRIVGTALFAVPNGSGYFTIEGITPGTDIVVEAELTGLPIPQTQQETIDLEPGEGREVIFNFP